MMVSAFPGCFPDGDERGATQVGDVRPEGKCVWLSVGGR